MEKDDHIDSQMPPEKDRPPMPDDLREELEIAAAAREDGLSVERTVLNVRSHRLIRKVLSRYPDALEVPAGSNEDVAAGPRLAEHAEADDYDTAFERMAAADASGETDTFMGTAMGVAVPEEGPGTPRLFRIRAGVQGIGGSAGELKIYGYQADHGQGVTRPLDRLSEHIRALFRHVPALRRLRLEKRVVSVEIDGVGSAVVGYLGREKSLTLAVVVAVVKAAFKMEADDNYVFSGDIDFKGNLTQVGRIAEKTRAVLDQGKTMVLPARSPEGAISSDVSAGIDQGRVRLFATLADLLAGLYGFEPRALRKGRRKAPSMWCNRLFTGVHLFGAAALVLFVVGLFITGDFFYPSRLLIAFHLKDPSDRVFDWINLIYFLILIGVPIAVKSAYHLLTQKGFRRRKWKIVVVLASTLFWILFGASATAYINHLFETIEPVGRYEKVDHLMKYRTWPVFRWFLGGAEGGLRREFVRIRAKGEYGRSVDVGIELTRLHSLAKAPEAGMDKATVRGQFMDFANDFSATANLIIDRARNPAQAARLMQAYADYEKHIRKHPRADEAIFATVDLAAALVKRYLKSSDWPRFIETIKREYRVEEDGG